MCVCLCVCVSVCVCLCVCVYVCVARLWRRSANDLSTLTNRVSKKHQSRPRTTSIVMDIVKSCSRVISIAQELSDESST